ncbi:MAG: alpha/beta fold hydrolase [Actinomycetota bacterium]
MVSSRERRSPASRLGPKRRLSILGVSLALLTVSCADPAEESAAGNFYAVPRTFPGDAPGTIVRSEAMDPPSSSSLAWRIMYSSSNDAGDPIVVTGMVIAPTGIPPANGRPVVAWAHPTTGIDDSCAPSKQAEPFDSIMGLQEFLSKGWVVVATDYEGLGTDGEHPYLIGASEARSVIDSVRAAHALDGTNASTRFGVFGHSQGGHAALFTGQLAATQAPDLTLVGAVAAAPSGDLHEQFELSQNTEAYSYVGSYMVGSWSDLYDARLPTAVTPDAVGTVERLATECVVGGSKDADERLERIFDTDSTVTPSLWVDGFTNGDPWRSILETNSPGAEPIPVPTLITQGTSDKVIPASTTAQLATRLRSSGSTVTEQVLPGVPHTLAGEKSVPFAVEFFTDRFN